MAITRGNQTLASRMDVAAALALVAAVFLALALALVPAMTYAAEQASGAAMGEAEDQPAPEEPLAEDDAAPQEDGDGDSAPVDVAESATDSDDAVASQQPSEVDNGTAIMASDDAGEVAAPQDSADDDGEDAEKKAADPSKHYALRLIVDMAGASPRSEDAVLAERDGVYLLGFANEDAIAQAEQHYGAVAAWVQRDSVMGAAGDEADVPGASDDEVQIEQPEGSPDPVNDEDNAIVLMEAAAASGAAGAAGADKPLVALIDTGAPADPAVVGSVSVVGDDVSDYNGHATAMLQAMKKEDPDVKVLAIKALDDDGQGSASSVYAAIEYAIANGAKIINLSLSGYDNDGNAAIAEAVQHALDSDIAVIAAAGNGGYDASYFTPANIPGVFTVGACDEDGNVLESSNRGECVDGYVVAESTSVAAARVTGWLCASDSTADCRSIVGALVLGGRGLECKSPDKDTPTDVATAAVTRYGLSDGVAIHVNTVSQSGYNFSSSQGAVQSPTSGSWLNTAGQKSFVAVVTDYKSLAATPYVYWIPALDKWLIQSTSGGTSRTAVDTPAREWSGAFSVPAIYLPKIRFGGLWTDKNATGMLAFTKEGKITDEFESYAKSCKNNTLIEVYQAWELFDIVVTLDPGLDDSELLEAGTEQIFGVSYSGLYLDRELEKRMEHGDSTNVIETPSAQNKRFLGYYATINGSPTRVIDSSGELTRQSNILAGLLSDGPTLRAKWISGPVYEIGLDTGLGPITEYVYEVPNEDVYNDSGLDNAMAASENGVTPPTRDHYTFKGYYSRWDGNGDLLIDEGGFRNMDVFTNNYFNSNNTIYAHWVPDVYQVTLDNQDADTATPGAAYVYEKYESGIYHDANVANSVSPANPISVPAKTGKVFGGYYTLPNGDGVKYIDENGAITSNFSSTAFEDNTGVLYAYWEDLPASPVILPLTGGIGENKPLLWGSTIAVVGAAGFVLFRALRTFRRSAATASRARKSTPRRRTPVHARME